MAEKLLKSIRSISEEAITANLHRNLLEGFTGHEKVQTLEDNLSLLVESIGKLREQKGVNGRVVF
jgi:hypothetical protein